ncbi:MAG: hypothetical protein ACLQAH_16790 [Limisphaerales bacterium]
MKKRTLPKTLSTTAQCRFEFRNDPVWFWAELFLETDDGWQIVMARKWQKRLYPNGKFQAEFIREVQEVAFDTTSETGQVIAPINCVSEFWTPKFICRIADAIRRPRQRPAHRLLKSYLRASWKSNGLDQMDRKELAEHLSKYFGKITPNAAWQIAYRLDLFSKRTSGPKQVAGRL